MEGTINFEGTLSGGISGGGGGGSDVSITPTLESGTKIADYTIDSESGSLYAPPSTINRAQLPLLIIGDEIRIDLNNYYTKYDVNTLLNQNYQKKLYATSPIQINGEDYNQISLTFDIDDYAEESWVLNHFQQTLIAGNNISIENNVISASGGGINYSTTEQDTGITWIDGRHIYQKTIEIENFTTVNNTSRTYTTSDYISNVDFVIKSECIFITTANNFYIIPYLFNPTLGQYNMGLSIFTDELMFSFGNSAGGKSGTVYVTLSYVKVTT